jgi:hypothetical protein
MYNIGTHDYGTYQHFLVPEPENVPTVPWGSAVARSVAKLTKSFNSGATCASGSYSIYEICATRANFSAIPISKIWYWNSDQSSWTDELVLGAGNQHHPGWDGAEAAIRMDKITNGTYRLLVGRLLLGRYNTTPWIVEEWGK